MGLLKWLKRQPKKIDNLDGLIGDALGGGALGGLVGGIVSEALLRTIQGYTDEQAEQFIANMAFDGFWFKADDGRNALGIRMEPEAVTAAELLHDLEAFGRAVKRAVERVAKHG